MDPLTVAAERAGRPPVRVLHLTAVDDSVRYLLGGQLRWLGAQGFEVHVGCRPGVHAEHIRRELALPLHPIRFSRRMNPLADALALWDLWRLLRRERFGILHTHTPKPTLLGPIAARLAGVKLVVNTLRPVWSDSTPWPKRAFWKALDRLALGLSARVLAQNPDDVERYVRAGLCPAGKISALGNGIDLERFAPAAAGPEERRSIRRELGLPEEAPVVGMVGRFVREKGYEDFFAAVRRMREVRPEVRFLTAGEALGSDRDGLPGDLAERLGLAGAGVRLGQREDLPRVYAAMDLMLFTSRREVFPRVLMEAAAMGLPVVASDLAGCRRCVREGASGYLVPPGDAAAFAARGLELAGSAELRARMGAAARELAEAEFDERAVFRKVAECYRELLARRAEGR